MKVSITGDKGDDLVIHVVNPAAPGGCVLAGNTDSTPAPGGPAVIATAGPPACPGPRMIVDFGNYIA